VKGRDTTVAINSITQAQFDNVLCKGDPDFISGTTNVVFVSVAMSALTSGGSLLNKNNLTAINLYSVGTTKARGENILFGNEERKDVTYFAADGTDESVMTNVKQVRRLTQFSGSNITSMGDPSKDVILCVASYDGATTLANLVETITSDNDAGVGLELSTANPAVVPKSTIYFPIEDNFDQAGDPAGLGAIAGAANWGLENTGEIPEIDIKVDSIAVTAVTKKLKAKWTPELGQDLNAYHNLDAEVELTSILSEQIALEIDREILTDLVKGGTADALYWSRRPGRFLDRRTARPIGDDYANESMLGADFTGTVSEWYETLVETLNDVSAQLHHITNESLYVLSL